MQPGQHLFFVGAIKGPQWTANRVRHVVLIAGGAGITPCYQLAQGILGNAKDQTAVTLIYGANSDRDILWKSQMEEWQHAFPDRFKVLFTVSEPEENSTLTRGRVTASLLRDALPDLGSKESEVYVCGPPAMETALLGSRSTKGLLEELGYGKEQIHKF
ncbi:Oxidoreductase FAD/NAD(P)-binding protein [Cordyceps fumosorosea ARSEF 2679]|uniref:Oxidoreductase FAD/NAD(P)-binding protein n=1 Tax=Cordyceps fumosorosea (strain ARSEF 2679) TaxID=1081104 RepID=A0A168E2D6_CORFA|nr:Oxidoreductase FAD/NAD(P)-binding protein [Cordyceps fumosorosea ARSEF 2679]OAA73295.1 Oxidoreductase FAD/NAD(P)-binding protein [Cordyceps fumosorosea ARSEF 2679]